jgi:GNAT superfamily N-acetyltransferase
MTDIQIRHGGPEDAGIVLAMFDGAVEWLVARGSEGQWGKTPFSQDPKRVARVDGMVNSGGLRIAEVDGEPAGALVLLDTPPAHIPPVDEPEVYIDLLLTARTHAGLGIGSALVARARQETRERGVRLLRVDCWAGGDGSLVRYYQGQGFTPTETFDVRGWRGQVFEDRLRPAS